jgi:hypothetical protein
MILLDGKSTLPEGSCLLSQFFANEVLQSWWPSQDCVWVKDGEWHIQVQLGGAGMPKVLNDVDEYSFIVWLREDPSIRWMDYFDLAGPPPESSPPVYSPTPVFSPAPTPTAWPLPDE